MNHVRIHGDPFGEGPDSSRLRSFLRLSLGCGLRCSLSLAGLQDRPLGQGERAVPLTDGSRNLQVGTALPPAEVEVLLRAAGEAVAATAPIVVFAPTDVRADTRLQVGLEWPLATAVIAANEGHCAQDLLERVRAESRWAGSEDPPHSLPLRQLQPWLDLPPPTADGPLVHVGSLDPADGTDVMLWAWSQCDTTGGERLRLVVPAEQVGEQRALVAQNQTVDARTVEVVAAPFTPAHVHDARGIVLPWRQLQAPEVLVQALACGRAVAASRWQQTAPMLARPGVCVPIGGRRVSPPDGEPAGFEPDPQSVVAALRQLLAQPAGTNAIGDRARQHVHEHLVTARPSAPPAAVAELRKRRPTLVLQAPFFETSSSAELSIETARALCRRDNVDVQLVPIAPFQHDLAALRRRAPELIDRLTRRPGNVDLWLSSGWPVRADRPQCRVHALRVDWEYGSLPVELLPHVDQDADLVVVHSEFVSRTVQAAGRSPSHIRLVPHGVDAAMHEQALPDERILQFKGARPAVLFCGGLIWRKGIDAFLAAALAAYAKRPDFVLVVKSVGHDRHYGRHHMRELVERVQRTPGAPPLLLLTDSVSRVEMASIYAACDVLLHPYRGEGFGLPILEARACGLPVIATHGGGAQALLTGPGAYGIDAARRSVELPGAHVGAPWVLEPSAQHATRLLRETLDDLSARRTAATQFASSVRAAFDWDAAAAQLEQMANDARDPDRRAAVHVQPRIEPVVTVPRGERRAEPALP